MYVAKSGNRRLVYGADWTTAPGADDFRKEVRVLAKEHGAKYYVALPREGLQPLLGFVPVVKGGATKLYSAAALLPRFDPEMDNAIYGFEVGDGLYAIICCTGGLPMFDEVVGADQVDQWINRFLGQLGEVAGSTVRYKGDASVFAYRDVEVEAFHFDLGALSDDDFKAAQFKAAHPPVVLIAVTLAMLAAALGGWYAYDEYQQEQLRKRSAQQVDPNLLYDQSVTKALAESGVRAVVASRQIAEQMDKMPKYQGGWRLDKMSCKPPASCTSEWGGDNMPMASVQAFADELPKGWVAQYKSDFASITVTHDDSTAGKLPEGLKRDELPSAETFVLRIGTLIQQLKPLGINIQVQAPKTFAIPPVPAGQPPITENVLRKPVKEGIWSATLPMWAVDTLYNLPVNMMLGSMTLTTAGKDHLLQAEGKYYVGK